MKGILILLGKGDHQPQVVLNQLILGLISGLGQGLQLYLLDLRQGCSLVLQPLCGSPAIPELNAELALFFLTEQRVLTNLTHVHGEGIQGAAAPILLRVACARDDIIDELGLTGDDLNTGRSQGRLGFGQVCSLQAIQRLQDLSIS